MMPMKANPAAMAATRGYTSGGGRREVFQRTCFGSEEGRQKVVEESLDKSLEAAEEAEEEEEGDEEDMFLVAAAVQDAGGCFGLGSASPPPPPPPPGYPWLFVEAPSRMVSTPSVGIINER